MEGTQKKNIGGKKRKDSISRASRPQSITRRTGWRNKYTSIGFSQLTGTRSSFLYWGDPNQKTLNKRCWRESNAIVFGPWSVCSHTVQSIDQAPAALTDCSGYLWLFLLFFFSLLLSLSDSFSFYIDCHRPATILLSGGKREMARGVVYRPPCFQSDRWV